MGDGPPELQKATEGERGNVGLPPAFCLLLHIFLKLDPAGRLPPVGLLAAVQHQLVQLHEHLGHVPKVRARGPTGVGNTATGQGREARRGGLQGRGA